MHTQRLKPQLLLMVALVALATPAHAASAQAESCTSCVVSGGGGAPACDPGTFKGKETSFKLKLGRKLKEGAAEDSGNGASSCPKGAANSGDFEMSSASGGGATAISTLGWMSKIAGKVCPISEALQKLQWSARRAHMGRVSFDLQHPREAFNKALEGGKKAWDSHGELDVGLEIEAFRKDACCLEKRATQVKELQGLKLQIEIRGEVPVDVFSLGFSHVGEIKGRITPSFAEKRSLELGGTCEQTRCGPPGSFGVGIKGELIGDIMSGLTQVSGGIGGEGEGISKYCLDRPWISLEASLKAIKTWVKVSAAWGLFSHKRERELSPFNWKLPRKIFSFPQGPAADAAR